MCAQNFIDHPAIIGGPGVKIDESKFGKGKYNRGRMVDGHWVLEECYRDILCCRLAMSYQAMSTPFSTPDRS